MRLDGAQQAEFYRIKEEAKSKTSRLQADHDVLATAQVRCCCMLSWLVENLPSCHIWGCE